MKRHRPFVSCLTGLYACRWRRYERSCTQPEDCACFGLLVASFCITLLFLYFWGQAKNDYNDFDWWVVWTVSWFKLLSLFPKCLRDGFNFISLNIETS
uniref:Transmembrane protein n=1 Tax=Sphaeramia orbicularis TaxID=375764 RepID=A0A672Z3Q2_9TELE